MKTNESSPESSEKQLCTSCTTPNEPDVNFCAKCGAPLSSYATIGPFERLFAEGFIYRQAAEQPRHLIVVLGVWLIFGAIAMGGITLLMMGGGKDGLFGLTGVAMLVLSLLMIWRTTQSYLTRTRVAEKNDDE